MKTQPIDMRNERSGSSTLVDERHAFDSDAIRPRVRLLGIRRSRLGATETDRRLVRDWGLAMMMVYAGVTLAFWAFAAFCITVEPSSRSFMAEKQSRTGSDPSQAGRTAISNHGMNN